jgi:serine/threonine-protein kinase RsbT
VTTPNVAVSSRADVERIRRAARTLALDLGFGRDAAEQVTLAVSELATNLLKYAKEGHMVAAEIPGERPGIQIESHDTGPGIADIPSALVDGYSTGGGLGGGLAGVHRLMNEVEILSSPAGTHITARKWLPTSF